VDGKKVSKLDYCKIKHITGWVTFCWNFKKKESNGGNSHSRANLTFGALSEYPQRGKGRLIHG